jgi:hypothetical protein
VTGARTRRERQQATIIALVAEHELDRVSVLGREHLLDFPDDVIVRDLLFDHCPDAIA